MIKTELHKTIPGLRPRRNNGDLIYSPAGNNRKTGQNIGNDGLEDIRHQAMKNRPWLLSQLLKRTLNRTKDSTFDDPKRTARQQ